MALPVATAVAKNAAVKKFGMIIVVAILGFVIAMVMVSMMFATAAAGFLFGTSCNRFILGGEIGCSVNGSSTVSTGSLTITISSQQPAESAYALSHIPTKQTNPSVVTYPILYAAATQNGVCKLPWTILAGVTNQESTFGTSTSPGVQGGSNGAGAQGPFQFEPATFASYASPVPKFVGAARPPSVYDAVDATYAAARKLCSAGILTNPELALWTYNAGMNGVTVVMAHGQPLRYVFNDKSFLHSADNPLTYVKSVLAHAKLYAGASTGTGSSIPVNIEVPTFTSSTVANMQLRLAAWMAILGSGGSCHQLLNISCPNVVPTILSHGGITLSTQPSVMKQELTSATTPQQGDIVLFKGNTQSYGVVDLVGSRTLGASTIGVVGANNVTIVTMNTPIKVGAHVGSSTISYIGNPFG
ncbi:MAG: lysozyme family protein [Ferrimicrobium acidiphilum]